MPFEGFWTVYWGFVSFVFGAIVGSFLNVCVWRLPRGESLSHPPSHCPACSHTLRFLPDMIPLVSQLRTGSRCRYCGTHFSWRYFWVELFTALAFLAIYVRYAVLAPQSFQDNDEIVSAVTAMMFVAALIAIFFIDLEHYVIPDLLVVVAVVMGVSKDLYLISRGLRPLSEPVLGTVPVPLSILGAVVALWFLWQFAALATAALGKEAMGAGDSLLLAAMGSFLIPWPLMIVAFIVSVALGTVGGVTMSFLSRERPPDAAGDPAAAGPEGSTDPGTAGAGFDPAVDLSPDASGPPEPPPAYAEPLLESAAGTGYGSGDPREHEDAAAAHRGAAGVPAADPEAEAGPPLLPPASRWGRLVTVAGTWVAAAAVWLGAAQFRASPGTGLAVGGGLLAVAAVLLFFGLRLWVRADKEWLPAMDEFFEEGDPGPRFIPFGPYLVAGTLVAMFFGRQLVEWYAQTQLMLPPGSLAKLPWD